MRIIILLETLTIGGAELFGLRLANALSETDEVLLAIINGERVDPRLARAVAPGVRLEALRLPGKRWWWKVDTGLRRLGLDVSPLRWAQRRWLSRLVGSFAPTTVHSHLLKADRLALDVRDSGHAFRHVLTMHGDYAPFLHGHSDAQMIGVASVADAIVARTDAIVTICEEHRQFAAKRWPEALAKLVEITNGYAPADPGPAPVLPASSFRFGLVSRGVAGKGWAIAIEAFKRLARPDASLVLVGAGPAIDQLASVPQPANIIFAGESADPLGYIRQFDVGLLPTTFPHESLPTVIIEYLTCGKPVIATDVGEIASMLRAPDGSLAGSLLRFDGSVSSNELAERMGALMDNDPLRAAMAAAARDAATKFSMDRCVAAYRQLYGAV